MKLLSDFQIQSFLAVFPSAKQDESMARHTYLKIGGPARLFISLDKGDEVVRAVQCAKQNAIPWAVIGGGSNLLVSDEGFQGVVIQALDRSLSIDGTSVRVGAGAFTGFVAREVAKAGLAGFEWGIGVPGTIGGAVYGDAGCFGGEMRDVVESVEAYDVAHDRHATYSNEECRFGYRESRFKHEPHVILSTTLRLTPGNKEESLAKLEEIMAKRKDSQPQGAFSAGCLFKNFDYKNEEALDGLRRHDIRIPSTMTSKKRLGAGWLVDRAGLKGTTVGNAQVSPVHGNFLVNLGGASASDVIALASLVKTKIRDEFGIMLEDEVQLLGF